MIHQVVSIDISDPNNISYVPFGTISRICRQIFVSATFDPASSRIFFALERFGFEYEPLKIFYLYSVTFPDLTTITPFLFKQYSLYKSESLKSPMIPNGLFYYAINNDPLGLRLLKSIQ